MNKTPYYNLNKPEGTDYYNVDDFNQNADKLDTALHNQEVVVTQLQNHLINKSNPHEVTKSQIGLGNVQNTADSEKHVAYATSAGNAATVGGFTVEKNVPVDAKFTDTTYEPATASTNGLMSSSDKTKLNGINAGAEVNVQADWNETDTTSDAYINNKPSVPSKTSDLTNDSGFISTETDPTVPSWAKASSKPTYTASEVGAIPSTQKGAANGVAELDASGLIPSSQLPSYVDDVIEGYYNETDGKFYEESSYITEILGESGKIYISLDTTLPYRWSGSAFVQIPWGLVLGELSTTAYRGDRGKVAYDHSQITSGNPHNVTKADIGLGNVGNYKAVSTVANQGLTETEQANARSNIGAGASSFSGDYNDLTNKPTIPSLTSQLTNDSHYIAQYYQTSEPTSVNVGTVWIG